MKKILLTTTALTMLAGAAAADISMSGSGRLGVSTSGGASTIDSRVAIKFSGSGETDGGITFGGSLGIRSDDAGTTSTVVSSGQSVYLSNGTMTLRVGNTGGAIASTSGIWSRISVGYTGMSSGGLFGTGGTAAHTSGSSGAIGPHIVAVDFALGSANVTISAGTDTEIAANFSAGAATIGIGHDTGATTTGGTTLTVSFDAGSANIHAHYFQDAAGAASWFLGASMGVGAGSLNAFIGDAAGSARHGLGYSQSLGGGATLGLGYEDIAGTTTLEAGVKFGF
jgi:outer membrane protein OmpU